MRELRAPLRPRALLLLLALSGGAGAIAAVVTPAPAAHRLGVLWVPLLLALGAFGVQSTSLLLCFEGRRRPVILSQALFRFPLPVLREKILGAAALRRAERSAREPPRKGDDRRKSPRAPS